MKLGVSYNIFDGEELLPYSISGVRKIADIIVVVYQNTSNFGELNAGLKDYLISLKEQRLIDHLIEFEPRLLYDDNGIIDDSTGEFNERQKRNIALEYCRDNGCEQFMSLDCDEVFDADQLLYAFQEHCALEHGSSVCRLLTYYKKPTYQIVPMENYFAPLFYRIGTQSKFESRPSYPYFVDGTRRISTPNFCHAFNPTEITMYHYAYVRNNIARKVINSSARTHSLLQKMVIHRHETYKAGQKAMFIGGTEYAVTQCDNKFNIQI